MQVVIIEDELSASKRLKKMLLEIDPTIVVQAVLESVEDAVKWFGENPEPDIIFADIQLSDGLSFEIFEKIQVENTVIFTTAYDEYAVDAFKVNSIDYLLKPIDLQELAQSIQKYHKIQEKYGRRTQEKLASLLNRMATPGTEYRSRFLVKFGESLQSIAATETMYFLIENQLVFLVTKDAKRYVVDHSLDELMHQLNPKNFFQINRQMIVAFDAIKKIHPYFNSRLKLDLFPELKDEVLVSRKRVVQFKSWLDR